MRILYLHQYFTAPDTAGGTRSYEFARRLIADGHEVLMVTSSARLSKSYSTLKSGTLVKVAGIPTVIIQVPYSNEMSNAQRVRAFLVFAFYASKEAMRHEVDVIFATSTPLTIALPAIVGRLWQRIPMVFEVRDLWPELPIAVGALRNPIVIAFARLLEWIAYHSSAHLVALSPGMAAGIVRRGIAIERITVIPNGSDIALFDVPRNRGEPIRDQLGLTPDQPLIVYTGTFGRINGVGYLVDLAAAIIKISPDVRFLMVGEGKEYDEVLKRAKNVGVYETVLWIWEAQPKEQIPNILAAATIATSVFIDIKSMWNNSANKFFDAIAAGKPIVINYGGWQAELLHQSGAGIVLSGIDVDADAQKLTEWLKDRQGLERASAAARLLAYTEFDRDLMAKRLEEVFQKVYGE